MSEAEFRLAEELAKFKELNAELLSVIGWFVDEFGGTINQYDRIGPCYTFMDGTEVFDVSVILDRRELIDAARAAIAKAKGQS